MKEGNKIKSNIWFRASPDMLEALERIRQDLAEKNPGLAHLLTTAEIVRGVVRKGLGLSEAE